MNVVLVATRDPGGRRSGGRAVLDTVIRSLARLGHEVEVLVVTRQALAEGSWPDGVTVRRVMAPGLVTVACNILGRVMTGRSSLNEALFYGRNQVRQVRQAVGRTGADVVVADTLRAWELARGAHRPVVLALEDLLSQRYRRAADAQTRRDDHAAPVLGYYRESLPPPVRRPAEWAARHALVLESRLTSRREVVAGQGASVVTVVSPVEAATLAVRLGRPVTVSSVAVTGHSARHRALTTDDVVVFVGGLDYRPNVEALRWYRAVVLPALDRLTPRSVTLHAFGFAPDAVRAELESDRIVLHGFVRDLDAALEPLSIFVAPILDVGGIKIKVVEAMASGLCVVATTAAVAAIGAKNAEHCLVADDPQAFAAAVASVLGDPVKAGKLAMTGQGLVQSEFSPDVVAGRWAQMLEAAVA
jgi:glycosyltransferase involved in cell wall biosynthesis